MPDGGEPGPVRQRRRTNRETSWGTVAYVAITLVTLAVIWGLLLATVLVDRSGDTTAALLRVIGTGQQGRQETITELQEDLDQARTAATREAQQSRRQASTSASRAADLSQQNATAWRDTARESGANLAAASNRRLSLAEAALQRSEARQIEAAAAARTALASAAAQRSAAETRARVAEAAARAALEHTRVQSAALTVPDRLGRAQQEFDVLLDRCPPGTVDVDLENAGTHLSRARAALAAAFALLVDLDPGGRTAPIGHRLSAARAELSQAESRLSRARRHTAGAGTGATEPRGSGTPPPSATPTQRDPLPRS